MRTNAIFLAFGLGSGLMFWSCNNQPAAYNQEQAVEESAKKAGEQQTSLAGKDIQTGQQYVLMGALKGTITPDKGRPCTNKQQAFPLAGKGEMQGFFGAMQTESDYCITLDPVTGEDGKNAGWHSAFSGNGQLRDAQNGQNACYFEVANGEIFFYPEGKGTFVRNLVFKGGAGKYQKVTGEATEEGTFSYAIDPAGKLVYPISWTSNVTGFVQF